MAEEIVQLCEKNRTAKKTTGKWNEKDAILAMYPDSIIKHGYPPLYSLRKFSEKYLRDRFSCIHILPFYPSSSDGGFAVMDYSSVSKKLGTWQDIAQVSTGFDLMFDFVANHVSQHSKWFTDYILGKEGAADFFIETDTYHCSPASLRPGTNDYTTLVNTSNGVRSVCSTFSGDQIDLNYKNPEVLMEMISIMAQYIKNKARIIRIGAASYLWKEAGTGNMHLDQAHALIKIFRTVAESINPYVSIVAEVNGTDSDNHRYAGHGDEAHIIYQHNLPAVLLHALHYGTAMRISQWARKLPDLDKGCTYINMNATHDGIAMILEDGIVPEHEMQEMLDAKLKNGGRISWCTLADGTQKPFELNISYFDALRSIHSGEDGMQIQRYICAHAIAMSLKGIPAIYLHNLLATPNDYDTFFATGHQRNLHRRQLTTEDIKHIMKISWHPTKKVFSRLLELLEIRRMQPAFHPDAEQIIADAPHSLFAVRRSSAEQNLIMIANVTNESVTADLLSIAGQYRFTDITDGAPLPASAVMQPYDYLWIELH